MTQRFTGPDWCSQCGAYLKLVDEKVIGVCDPGRCDKCSEITVARILAIEERLRELESSIKTMEYGNDD